MLVVSAVFLCLCTLAFLSTNASPTTSFPPPIFTVQLVAFHGDQLNYNITNTVGQRWAGHLGIRYAKNLKDIFGFNPAASADLSRSQRTDLLLNGTAYAGKVSNDNHMFEDALHSPYGFTVVFYDVPQDRCMHPDCGHSLLQNDVRTSPLNHKLYAYPPSAPRVYRNLNYSACDSTWGQSCFNCGTYIASLGIEPVEETGLFKTYIPSLAAQPTSFCRCYVGGEWVESQYCVRDYLQECDYQNPVAEVDSASIRRNAIELNGEGRDTMFMSN